MFYFVKNFYMGMIERKKKTLGSAEKMGLVG